MNTDRVGRSSNQLKDLDKHDKDYNWEIKCSNISKMISSTTNNQINEIVITSVV